MAQNKIPNTYTPIAVRWQLGRRNEADSAGRRKKPFHEQEMRTAKYG